MVERQLKGLCYNYDDKYFPGHKRKEQNIFMDISKDVSEEYVEAPLWPSHLAPPSDPLEVELVISLNSPTGFSAPQTLKLTSYIKHQKVVILVDSGSTHKFIYHHISK
jgi:hypothetical protein